MDGIDTPTMRYGFGFDNRLYIAAGKGQYRYDGEGRRVLAWSPVDGTSALSQYSKFGQLMYYSKSSGAGLEHIYLRGSLIAKRETVGNVVKFQHTDALGSPAAVTDGSGNVIERNDYAPYGAVIGKPAYDAVGYTGHKQDGATGLTYMQQRYYDPQIGRFLSVEPVTAYGNPVGAFNRYWYANNCPYKFVDPDGRAPCTGTKIGTCVGGKTLMVGEGALRAIKRDPQGYLNKLNGIANNHGMDNDEAKAARYFARTALPVTIATGREVGADIARMGKGYSVFSYVLGSESRGDGSGSVTLGQAYFGPGARTAIIHTHPADTNFNGSPGGLSNGKWTGYANPGFQSDIGRSVFSNSNGCVVMLGGGILKFDFESMSCQASAPGANLNVESFISRLPDDE